VYNTYPNAFHFQVSVASKPLGWRRSTTGAQAGQEVTRAAGTKLTATLLTHYHEKHSRESTII